MGVAAAGRQRGAGACRRRWLEHPSPPSSSWRRWPREPDLPSTRRCCCGQEELLPSTTRCCCDHDDGDDVQPDHDNALHCPTCSLLYQTRSSVRRQSSAILWTRSQNLARRRRSARRWSRSSVRHWSSARRWFEELGETTRLGS